MRFRWFDFSALAALVAVLATTPNQGIAQATTVDPLEVGQVWTYKTRDGEPDSRVVICRLQEAGELGRIVHIQVTGVRIRNPSSPEEELDVIGHLPFSEQSLRGSLETLEGRAGDPPDCEEGYQTWREAFDAGQAGMFTVSVAEAVAFVEQALGG